MNQIAHGFPSIHDSFSIVADLSWTGVLAIESPGMAGKLRVGISRAHLSDASRGSRELIFRDDQGRQRFFNTLAEVRPRPYAARYKALIVDGSGSGFESRL